MAFSHCNLWNKLMVGWLKYRMRHYGRMMGINCVVAGVPAKVIKENVK